MNFVYDRRNALPTICELSFELEPTDWHQTEFAVNVELRVFHDDLPLGDEEYQICVEKLTLSVDSSGFEILKATRYGEPTVNNEVPIDSTHNHERNSEQYDDKSAGIGASIRNANAGVDAQIKSNLGISKKTYVSSVDKYQEKFSHHRVTARPDMNWEICEKDAQPLSATYLNNECLCRVKPTELNCNNLTISLTASVKQRDILFSGIIQDEESVTFFSRTKNKKRLLDIFIAKSLSAKHHRGGRYKGLIELSHSEAEIQIDE